MKTNLLAAWVLLLGLTGSVLGQASKQVLTVETLADLRARRPQTNEVVQVRHGSSSNLWAAPRTFVHDPSSAAAADNVFVTTNASASGRYEATDLGSSVLDVRWFGAVGDATTDDTAAVQAAIDAVKVSGGTVYFPDGRYRLSQSLDGTTAATGFSMQGAGKENTVILGSDPGYPLLDFTGANGVSLRDLTVWGNAAGTNVSLCGILWGRPASNASSGEHHMERVKVWGNFQKWGVIANSAELCVYRDCEFYAGYNLAPPDNAMTAFCLSGGSGTRGLTSRYNAPGNGSGGNSSQSFYDCKFYNYVPTTVTGYFTTYNLELDGVMTCTMVNPYYYSRYNGTQVKLNNLSTSAFDTLDIIGARHEYLTPLSGGTEPASYSAAASEKFKSIRIQGGTLTYFYGEGGSWITGLKINDVVWKTIASVPVVDVWILIDSDLTANKGGDGSFAQTQTPTYSIRGWSHNVNLDYQKTQNYGMHSSPDLGFGRRGLLWDGATDNSALLYNIPTNRIGTNDFTIYLRVRLPASMPGNHAGIATLTANPSGIAQASAWTARLNTDGRIETFLFDATGLQNQSKYVPLDFYTQNKGEICDLVFVRNTNDCRVYINGYYARGDEDQSTGSPPGWGAHINASVFALGISGAASQYWRSEMYRAALFDRALSDTEILALTHSTLQLDTDALIPNLTQGHGTTIGDLGSGNYSGTLVGGVSHLLLSRPNSGLSVVSVMDFGAIPDDDGDDTAAIQAAIDSLPLPATNSLFLERGGSVFIPDGIYKITGPIRMRPGKLEGSSRFGTVLINYGLTNDVIACMTPSNTPPTGIWMYRVAHMSIHQADATIPTAGAAIRVQSDDGVTASMADVEDVFIHGTFRGFHGSALQGSSLKTLTVYATKDDGILWDVYQTMVQAIGCWTYYCGQNGTGHGWHLKGPAYCTVSASGADSNYGWGWYVESGTVQAPRGNTFTVGAEQNRDGGILIKNAIGGVYSPMVVTPDDLPTAADGIVVDNGRMVGLVGAFTQQGAIGGTGYPLRITNGVPDYPSVTVNASYLNSYNTGSEYHQTIGIGTYLPWEERGFIGLNTDGKPRRMLDVHDRTGAAGNTTGHELARLALHTTDNNGNAFISLSPDGEASFFKIIANNPSSNTVFNVGTNADVVFHAPGAPLSGDGGSFLFQIGGTPVMALKGGDTLGSMGLGIMRPNPAALLDVRSSTRGILLPSWESTEFKSGLYGSGQYTPPGLLAYDSDARSIRVQTRNSDDGLTNNQWTSLFGYVDRDLRLGTAHRLVGTIFPQSINATDTNIGSVYLSFTAEGKVGLELEQNSFRAGPYQYGTFGDTIIRNSYTNTAGAYGNLLLMAGENASVTIGNGTDRAAVTVNSNLTVAGTITLGGVPRSSWPGGADWVNVLDYGVDDDPGTDDTLALQAAAAALLPGQTLYAPPGLVFRTTNTVQIDDSRSRVDFSGSTIQSFDLLRRPVLRVGPAVTVVTNMDFALDPATNRVTGVPAATFSAGDMVMLYNDVQSPPNYNPGQFAFVESASGTEIVLDRFPDASLQVTNAYRFATPPESVEIRNVVIDLSGASDGTGISVIGRGHLVENCRVTGTGTTNDPNYIGIELRGQSITARKNFVQGILDAGNATDRSGYGIFAAGDNIVVDDNELLDCKHCVSTSERKAISQEIKVTNNRIRQRDDWAAITDVNGNYLFTGALDVHANVRHIEFRGNDVKIGGRYALSLRNGNWDVLFNRIEVTTQTLPFAQHTIGLAEVLTDRGLFHGNQFITADGATLLYFAQADSGVSGTHSNISFVANSFKNCILSLDDFDTTASVTNRFANTVIAGNTFNRPGGTTLLFSGPSSNAIVTGNAFTHGGSGISIAVPGDDSTNPAREIYVAGNTFNRTGGSAGDVRVLSGPTNIVELGNNRFSEVPTQGFDGRVAVSRTPAASYRTQLIEADDDELLFNSPTGTNPARLKWGGTGALLGNDSEFVAYRTLATDRAFASYHTDTNGLPFVDQYQFVIKSDGLMSWSDGDNAAQIVLGPRRNADVTNGVIRLSGGLGLSERTEPIQPSSTTATIWLEEADSSKSIKVKWPDGSNTALYPQAGGGGGDVTLAGTNAFTGPNSFAGTTTFNGAVNLNGTTTISNLTVPGTLSAAAFSTATPLGFASGGHGATNAAGARTALGLDIGSDVQAWSAYLQQLATVSWASGDVPYFDGSNLTNLTMTAAGRTLLTAANAAAQWLALASSATTNGAYNATTWDGITDRVPNLDQFRDVISALPGGTGDVVGPASTTTNNIAVFADATGKVIADGGVTVASLATEAEVAAGYEPLNSNKYQSTNATLTAASTSGSTGTGAFVRADSPTVTGTWAFDTFTANTLTVLSNLYAVTVAYGAAWNGSSNVPTRNDVYDEMELRALKNSPALTGDPTAPTATTGDADTSLATTAFVTDVATGNSLSDTGWIIDELITGAASSGDRGTTGTANNGTIGYGLNSNSGHPGMRFLRSNSAADYPVFGWLGASGAFPCKLATGETHQFGVLFQLPSTLSNDTDTYEPRVGFTENFASTNTPTDGAYCFANTNILANGNWALITVSNAVAEAAVDTGVAASASAFYYMHFKLTSSNAIVSINGVARVTNTTRIPLGRSFGMALGQAHFAGTANRDLYADRFAYRWSGTTRMP